MANTYVINRQDVHGSWRVQYGTITPTDGGGTTTTYMVDTGLDTVLFACTHDGTDITISGGSIAPGTATSGGSDVDVLVFGV